MGIKTCKQCGRHFSHSPIYDGFTLTPSGLNSNGITTGFCSKGCLNAYRAEKEQSKEAAKQASAAKKLAKEEEKRRSLEKKHEEKRKEAQDALKKAKKKIKKWEEIAEKLEAALESDDMKELDDAVMSATSWGELLVGFLLLALIGGAVWYYFFGGKSYVINFLTQWLQWIS